MFLQINWIFSELSLRIFQRQKDRNQKQYREKFLIDFKENSLEHCFKENKMYELYQNISIQL